MKITLEPGKTTWVPFIESNAKVKISWTCKIEYTAYSIYNNNMHTANLRYVFSDLKGAQFIPSSQLIIKEEGIPLSITETVASPVKNKFKSEKIDDPFIEINDKIATIEKSKVISRTLSKRMIERAWTEKINRSVKIENKTGKKVLLKLSIVDKPAEELIFTSSEPAPSSKEPPEYYFDIELNEDDIKVIKLELKFKKLEKLELPPDIMKGNEQDAALVEQDQQAEPQLLSRNEINGLLDQTFSATESAEEEE